MNKEFRYLVELSTRYTELSEDATKLYRALSDLPDPILEENLTWYGDTTKKFQPVNLLRAEVIRLLKAGNTINDETVEEIKDRIRNKKVETFRDLPDRYSQEFRDHPIGKRDMFANWQRQWSIFFPFIFTDTERRTVQLFLERISKETLRLLELPDYTFHSVDFYGATNFGSEMCWVSLYPNKKDSHKQAYQFHIRISANPEAGMMPGSDIEDPEPEEEDGTFVAPGENWKAMSIFYGPIQLVDSTDYLDGEEQERYSGILIGVGIPRAGISYTGGPGKSNSGLVVTGGGCFVLCLGGASSIVDMNGQFRPIDSASGAVGFGTPQAGASIGLVGPSRPASPLEDPNIRRQRNRFHPGYYTGPRPR